MTVLVWLLLAHFITDFYLQPKSWVLDRERAHFKSLGLLKHTATHALTSALALGMCIFMSQLSFSVNVVLAWLAIWLSHYLIDVVKSYVKPSATALLLDQLAHIVMLTLIWGWLTGLWPFVMAWTLGFLLQRDMLIIAMAYLLAARPVSFFTAAVLQRQAEALAGSAQGLIEAGRMIGYVERWLIVSFVLTGQFIGIGFLLAAKSIFRFGDLSQAHERRLTEYMLLGTLVSFTSALAIGGLAVYLT